MSSGGLLSYSSLVHAVSGGCGSAVAMTVFYPLDTVRTRLQLLRKNSKCSSASSDSVVGMMMEILKKEGSAGLYRGLVPVLQSLYCSNFVYFYSFRGLKTALNPNKTAVNDLLCGMAAGVINVMTTTPLWVVNTRLKMQGTSMDDNKNHYSGLIDGLCGVYQQEGVAGLWSSCGPSLMLVINPAIQFMVYEHFKRVMAARNGGVAASAALIFLSGAVAKAVATTLTYPLQLAQALQRHGRSAEARHSVVRLLIAVLKEGGPAGLFRGLKAKLLQTVLTAALMFLCYEKIVAFVFAVLMGHRKTAVTVM